MAVPIWPEELPPYFLVDGFSYAFADGRIVSKPERGSPKTRRGSSAAVTPISGAFQGGYNDWLQLEAFYYEELGGGALPFLMRDRLLDGAVLTNGDGTLSLGDGGEPLIMDSWWLCLFDGVPSFVSMGGDVFRVSFTLNKLRD